MIRELALLALFSSTVLGQAVAPQTTLSVNVRMVEVYASVLDSHGKHVLGLGKDQFEIAEDGQVQKVQLFESQAAALSTALLIDTTGSMLRDLPRVKNAVSNLLSLMKPEDSFGLFSFDTRLTILHPFSRDRASAMRALLRTRASGATALYDALTQLASEVSKSSGKKVILLFTDGDDNSSIMTREAAERNVKRVGVPIYAVAEGAALASKPLMKSLEEICRSTGGLIFQARKSDDLAHIFGEIGRDLQYLYLVGYYPSLDHQRKTDWHRVSVRLPQHRDFKIRAKEGYWQ